METVRVYINRDHEGEIVCPNCGRERTIHVSKHRILKNPVRVKCHCGHSFSVSLEYRRYHRKKVNIPGKLLDPSSKKEIDDVIITSLSVAGVGFEVKSFNYIKVGDVFEIVFTLDDDFGSTIREAIVVRRVDKNSIGAEFCDQDKYNHELDFYIFSEFPLP
jgi:predicted RNA-binding Zn-ribbon protein involved in translation (DUF1610 family)